MPPLETTRSGTTKAAGRITGLALLGLIGTGILAAFALGTDLDVNMTADVEATGAAMLEGGGRLHAAAYLGVLTAALELLVVSGFFVLLARHDLLLAVWGLLLGLTGVALGLAGSLAALNAAEIAARPSLAAQGAMLASVEALRDYTGFHLGLLVSSLSNAVFFVLFLAARAIPRLIAAWGLFASLLVAGVLIGRDFVPVLGSASVTAAFLAANLVALVSTGGWLALKGVRG